MLLGSYSLAPRKRSDPSQSLSLDCGPAQVRLVSEHDKEFCVLAVGSVFNYPRRDLAMNALSSTRWLIAREEPVPPTTAIVAAMNRTEQKTIRSRDDSDARFGCLAIVRNSRLL